MHYVAYLTSGIRCTKLSSLSVANKEVIGHSPNNCKDTKPPKDGIFSKIGMERDLAAGVYLSEAPSPPRFLFGVVKQFCRFGIWSYTQ